MAKAPATFRSSAIGEPRRVQFVCDIYFAEVHAGVVDYARTAGWALFDGKCYVPSMTYTEPCDGILAVATLPDLAKWLVTQNCPVVRMLCTSLKLPFPSVEPDVPAIGVRAAEHFLSLGAPHYVFYTGWLTEEVEAMWRGFSGALAVAGKSAKLLDFGAGRDPSSAPLHLRRDRWVWLAEELRKLPRPLAVFAEDDRFAYDLIEAAAILGWRIPEDMAVLGSDNRTLILGKFPIPVSSVDSNLHGIGWAGAALLDRILDGAPPPVGPRRIAPGQVVARHSTATFVCEHRGVATAINYLRTRFQEPIDLATLARVAGVSTRSLQTACRQYLGCTLSAELSRTRLAHAARLLRETDLKLESVAQESGLQNAKYLCRVFRAAFDLTPARYRAAERTAAGGQSH